MVHDPALREYMWSIDRRGDRYRIDTGVSNPRGTTHDHA
jgi:hypothetical protein